MFRPFAVNMGSIACRGGSHYNVLHFSQRDILTIPSRRPIKPVYVRQLVRYIEAVKAVENNG